MHRHHASLSSAARFGGFKPPKSRTHQAAMRGHARGHSAATLRPCGALTSSPHAPGHRPAKAPPPFRPRAAPLSAPDPRGAHRQDTPGSTDQRPPAASCGRERRPQPATERRHAGGVLCGSVQLAAQRPEAGSSRRLSRQAARAVHTARPAHRGGRHASPQPAPTRKQLVQPERTPAAVRRVRYAQS